jgi:hypothetical protein
MAQINIPNIPPSVSYLVTSPSTGPFVVPFAFFVEGDVKALVTDALGAETDLVHSTDFTFNQLDAPVPQEGNGYTGGEITLNVSIGADGNTTLKIYRDTVIDRTANYPHTGPFSMIILNDEQNKHVAIMQELQETIDNLSAAGLAPLSLQDVTDVGNTTTNDIELDGSKLLLDDAGEIQFGDVAGGEINIKYDAAGNDLVVYDASATNTGFRVGAGINNFFVNPEQNANSVVTIGESSTLRGDAQQSLFNMYGEDGGVIRLAQVQNTGALFWFNVATLPIQFNCTTFDINATDVDMNESPFQDFAIKHQSVSSAAGALVLPYRSGQSIALTLTENVTSTTFDQLPNTGKLAQLEIELTQDAGSAYTVNWGAFVRWPGGTAPDLSTLGSVHLIHFRTRDGGSNIYGTFASDFS